MAQIIDPILELPRTAKRIIALMVDITLCVLAVWVAYYLRLGELRAISSGNELWATVVSVVIALPIFITFGLYRAIFRYSGAPAFAAIVKAMSLYGGIYAAIFTFVSFRDIPRTVGIIQPLILFLLIGLSRWFAKFWLGGQYQLQLQRAHLPRVLIYGAGSAGRQFAAAIANSNSMTVVGFLDDDDRLHGQILNGLPIYDPLEIVRTISKKNVTDVLLAIPSVSRKRRNEIINKLLEAKVSVRMVPGVTQLAQGKIEFSDLRELEIDDLLGRDPVAPNPILLSKNITGKIVLVTGAGGSIGSELCRQIITNHPKKLLLIEQSEFALYDIHQELLLKSEFDSEKIVPLLASVRDYDRMVDIMATWKPDTVYHAAAYKHVPIVEHNPAEGIKNNVFGTLLTAKAAVQQHVSDFVLISTDKAVRPTNIMGATKRLAEMVLQSFAIPSATTRFTMVRFGNVLGSSGSVVPKFREQIRKGGPITLTHPEITRYFMTIPEAAQLVIQAGALAKGGDVFVLDMGQPVKILDLAKRMIELSGLTIRDEQNPNGDIGIELTGLRPGEKLYEELLIGADAEQTSHPRIMRAHEDFLPWNKLQPILDQLETALNQGDLDQIRRLLISLVSGYEPTQEIVDWIFLEKN